MQTNDIGDNTNATPSPDVALKSSPAATALGFGAILLWSTLASLTALKGGAIPPFQTTAITFAIGGLLLLLTAVARGRRRALVPTRASLTLGVVGLFAYHALYFAALKLAPPAEASLITSLWALLTVVFSAFLPGHSLKTRHIVGALLGLVAATILVSSARGGDNTAARSSALGFALAFGCAVVWAGYSVLSRLVAAVPSESLAIPCLLTSALALGCHAAFETWITPPTLTSWLALVLLGLGPVGAAFMLWDIGMKKGNIAQLGVLAYAVPVISTLLLVALGLTVPKYSLAIACLLMIIAAAVALRDK